MGRWGALFPSLGCLPAHNTLCPWALSRQGPGWQAQGPLSPGVFCPQSLALGSLPPLPYERVRLLALLCQFCKSDPALLSCWGLQLDMQPAKLEASWEQGGLCVRHRQSPIKGAWGPQRQVRQTLQFHPSTGVQSPPPPFSASPWPCLGRFTGFPGETPPPTFIGC